jgi:hypothetical protein
MGSSKANKQIRRLLPHGKQDVRVLLNGLLSGIGCIPLMKDGEAISLRLADVKNGGAFKIPIPKIRIDASFSPNVHGVFITSQSHKP